MRASIKFQSALYLYILIIIGLALVIPPKYALEIVLIILFLMVSSGSIFYTLLMASLGKRYPYDETGFNLEFLEPLVYVLIPAHNEERVIYKTVRSVLGQDYRNMKVILINDNSTDRTRDIMEEINRKYPRKVVIIDVPPERGRSKPRALNYALEIIEKYMTHPNYVFILDADYLIPPNALKTLVSIMESAPQYVIGIQGNVRPRNFRKNFVTKFITLERLVGFNVAIEGDMKLNENGKYGGTVALLRFPLLIRLGKFREDSVTEDTDLWARAMIAGYRFWYYHGVIGWEEAVETLRDYIKQRSRWAQGHLQVMIDHYWPVMRSCSNIIESFIEHFYMMSYLVPVFWFLSVILNSYLIITGAPPLSFARPKLFLSVSIFTFLLFWFSVAYSNWVEKKRHNYYVPWSFVALYPLYFMVFVIAGVIYTMRGLIRLLVGRLHWEKTKRFT
ncbi:glycosyltransferase family 2 protein [Pyrococcus abyssi]|nr:glycosyltransferase family 2 protein [Pyrococcus abyssi]CCE71136.1 TPA: glycosyl transferase family protein [Pyrococcus abyssi GE5]